MKAVKRKKYDSIVNTYLPIFGKVDGSLESHSLCSNQSLCSVLSQTNSLSEYYSLALKSSIKIVSSIETHERK